MSETIKVALEADATQLTNEFKKAQATAEAFSKKTLPLVAQELNRTYLESNKLRKGNKELSRGMRTSGNDMLAFAAAADDAQYGIRGLSNQIPQLAQSLGLGAGLAGGIAIAAVALVQLDKLFKNLSGVDNQIAYDKATEAAEASGRAVTQSLQEQTARRREQADIAREQATLYQKEKTEVEELLNLDRGRAKFAERREQALAKTRSLEDALRGAKQEAAPDRPDKAVSTLNENFTVEQTRRAEDLQKLQKELARTIAESSSAYQSTAPKVGEYQLSIARLRNELEQLEDQNNITAGSLKTAQDKLSNAPSSRRGISSQVRNDERNAKILRERDAAEKKKLADLKAQLATMERLSNEASEQLRTQQDVAGTAAADLRDRISGLKKEIAAYEEIYKIQKQTAEVRAGATTTAPVLGPVQGVGTPEEVAGIAEAAQKQAAARRDFAIELQVLDLRARGQAAAADALEREQRLRGESVRLAQELGITEKQALEVARRRAELIEGGNRSDRPLRPTSRIGGDRPGSGLRIGRLETSRGLRTSALDREAAARATPENTLASKAASYYERSLANEEALIKIFNKLGVY